MKSVFQRVVKYATLFLIFGCIYFIIECIFKGKVSDWRMLCLGGFCAVLIGLINNLFTFDTDFILQCLFGGMLVTLCEAIGGTYWNSIGLHMWNYSTLPLSAVNGTINLFFSIAWCGLSFICILLDDFIRYKFFHETDSPYYVIHGKKVFGIGGNN